MNDPIEQFIRRQRPMTPDERADLNAFVFSELREKPPLWRRLIPWILSAIIMALLLPVHPAELTDADLEKITREDIARTLRHIQAIAREAQSRADEAEAQEAKTLGALQEMTRQNTALETSIVTIERTSAAVEKDRDAQAMRANAEHERAGRLELRAVKAEKRMVIAIGTAGAALLACAVMGYLLLKP